VSDYRGWNPLVIENSDGKGVEVVQPVLMVVEDGWVAVRFGSVGQSVWSYMLLSGHMHQLEREQQDPSDPSVDGSIGLEIRVVDHTLDVLGIEFHCEVSDPKRVDADST
jgi:hypothetical protein